MLQNWLPTYQDRVNHTIQDIFSKRYGADYDSAEREFFEAMQYAVEGGGKRLRAILAILAYEQISEQEMNPKILQAIVGIEMIHAFTLVHDDLPCMDNDVLRRGKPTVWKAYGETIAVLVGDALQTLGFELLAMSGDIRVITEISRAIGDLGVARGQVRDTILLQNSLTFDELIRIHDEKTGGFIAASLVIGAMLTGADEVFLQKIHHIGMLLGRAFQTRDDILDYEGDPNVIGKMTQKDSALGKGIVALIGIDRAREYLVDLQSQMMRELESIQSEKLHELAEYIVTREK